MKTYRLKSVEHEGRKYSDCSLVIDGEARRANVLRSVGLIRKSQASLVGPPLGPETAVQLVGVVVKWGSFTLVAEDEATAREISTALRGPAGTPAQSAADDKVLKLLQDSVSDFLRARQKGIDFLLDLKKDARQALVGKSSSYTGKYENPALEYLEGVSASLAEAYSRMNSAAAALQGGVGKVRVEQVYAFVYAMGVYQDGLVLGGDSSELWAFLKELGIDTGPKTEPESRIDIETMLQSAGVVLFSSNPSNK